MLLSHTRRGRAESHRSCGLRFLALEATGRFYWLIRQNRSQHTTPLLWELISFLFLGCLGGIKKKKKMALHRGTHPSHNRGMTLTFNPVGETAGRHTAVRGTQRNVHADRCGFDSECGRFEVSFTDYCKKKLYLYYMAFVFFQPVKSRVIGRFVFVV